MSRPEKYNTEKIKEPELRGGLRFFSSGGEENMKKLGLEPERRKLRGQEEHKETMALRGLGEN